MRWLLKLLPEISRAGLAERVRARLAASGVAAERLAYDAEAFQFTLGEQRIFLGNLYRECQTLWPWQRRGRIAQFLRSVTEPLERPATFAEARGALLPGVRDAFMPEALYLDSELQGKERVALPGFALGPRLRVCLFLDSELSTRMVAASDLEDWGVSFDEAYQAALENLQARSRAPFEPLAPGLYHSTWADCYDPARLLLPGKLAELELEGSPVCFAPNWAHLFVAGESDLNALGAGLSVALGVLQEQPRPMSALPLVKRGGEWVALELPRGHALEPLLRKVRVIEYQNVYEQQTELLTKVCRRRGEDVYVALLGATRDPQTDSHSSFTVWSKGIPSLLPLAETIGFSDDAQPEGARVGPRIDWDIVRLHCAPLMRQTDHVLPRYHVDAFPDAAALEAMQQAQAARDAA